MLDRGRRLSFNLGFLHRFMASLHTHHTKHQNKNKTKKQKTRQNKTKNKTKQNKTKTKQKQTKKSINYVNHLLF